MLRIVDLLVLVNVLIWGCSLSHFAGADESPSDESTSVESTPQSSRPPNIVLIVSDDQGYADLGCLSDGRIRTPHLDRLAAEGTRLTNFYVAWPACTPSRAALLTGRYPQRNGMYDMVRNEAPDYGYLYKPGEYDVTFERIGGLDTAEVLLPSLLQAAGYRTAIFGKWDLGTLNRYLPTSRGFDQFYGFVNTGIDYFTHERYGMPSMYRNTSPTDVDRGTCSTELFRREAVHFINEEHERPFFLYLPFNAPHNASNLDPRIRGGAQASPEFLAMYPEFSDTAAYQSVVRYGEPAESPNAAMSRLLYCAAVSEMDAATGEVLQLLDQYQISDNTLVIFFSDNGGSGGADNTPLRGRKSQMWEGGIRVPCIVRFPGRVPAGHVSDQFLSSLEIFPTLLSVAGIEKPKDLILDGFDMLPILAGSQQYLRTQMFWQRRNEKAARVGSWKWVEMNRGGGLFNLAEDIAEKHDRSNDQPQKLAELQSAFQEWTEQMLSAEPRGPFRDF